MFKEIAYQAQQQLQSATSVRFSRAHLYEWVSAGFGFKSYAAFSVDHLLVRGQPGMPRAPWSAEWMEGRGRALGYTPLLSAQATALLEAMLIERELTVLSLSSLLDELCTLRDAWGAGEWPNEDFGDSSLQGSLREAAERGNIKAHMALALILEPSEDDDWLEGRYWYEQQQKGQVLEGATKEWALAYEVGRNRDEAFTFHLAEAARLANSMAQPERADHVDDPTFFDREVAPYSWGPREIAAMAEQLGGIEDERRWLNIAAEQGDTDAMRDLIEHYDQEDLLRCWMWVHLSRLLHHDLTLDRYHAINPDGSEYDDDVGGPAELGGQEGVELRPLPAAEDQQARDAAESLFRKIEAARR
ncbi:hypothetical protein [Stenotrophomonas sp.]|uniref:hypothetical protein n=1 Tax=Stenotrophomonas sp. TaxID=69392 RepID=UPI00289DD59A|nr:hypothetical protein [Stenotrophomonas sp.]